MSTGSNAAPGWYPEPGSPTGQRYWDGTAWTEHTTPATPTAPPPLAPAAARPVPSAVPPATSAALPRDAPVTPAAKVKRPRNIPAETALIIALFSLVLALWGIAIAAAAALGIFGIVRAARLQRETGVATGRKMSVVALAIAALSLLLFLVFQLPNLTGGLVFDKATTEQSIIGDAVEQGGKLLERVALKTVEIRIH